MKLDEELNELLFAKLAKRKEELSLLDIKIKKMEERRIEVLETCRYIIEILDHGKS